MKNSIIKLTYTLLLTLIINFQFSCQKEIQEKHIIDENSIKGLLFKKGFDTTNIHETSEYYIIEGDILLKKSELLKTYPRQSSVTATTPIDPCYQNLITVAIDNSIPNDLNSWRDAIGDALKTYNEELNSSIKFVLVPGTSANLVIRAESYVGELGGFIAGAQWPLYGAAGNLMIINLGYSSYNYSQKKLIIIHELGHSLGLRHTDWNTFGEAEFVPDRGFTMGAYTIGDSPYNDDPESVFRKYIGGLEWSSTGFTYWDKYALEFLYPRQQYLPSTEREINGLDSYLMSQQLSAGIYPNSDDIYYRWYVNNVLVKEGNLGYLYCTCYGDSDARQVGQNTIRLEIEMDCGKTEIFETNFEMFP